MGPDRPKIREMKLSISRNFPFYEKYHEHYFVSSQTDNSLVPKGYENSPFYFWFNTAFVGSRLLLTREELDNPHKNKTWHCFRPNFTVELVFQEISSSC